MSIESPTDERPLVYWHPGAECCDAAWEAAYARFETPEQEVAKFLRRFRQMGVNQWPRTLQIAELFCGRGNGLVALEQSGFTDLRGVDLAPSLLQQYDGPARLFVADCRYLGFEDASLDAVVIQGGLHHLPELPNDVAMVLDEIDRVLRPGGRVLIVEPWKTPFLQTVHFLAKRTLVRRLSGTFNAFQEMTEREQTTYDAWLSRPDELLSLLRKRFETEKLRIAYGKLMFCGRKSFAL